MKINWFSPLPPLRSSIAHQTGVLAPELSRHADLVVWSSDPRWDREIEDHAEVRHYDISNPPWREIADADATFFQMGNDPHYHDTIWRISRQHPGIVLMHDLKLQHLFAGLHVEVNTFTREEYLALMQRYYQMRGRILAASYLDGTLPFDDLADACPLILAPLEGALAAIVHTTAAYESLARETDVPIAYLPLPAARLIPAEAALRCVRLPGEPMRIIIFGILTPNRRLPAFFEALASLPRPDRFRVDIYGTIEGENDVRDCIHRLELSAIVRLHGFVSDAVLEQALAQSDVAVNLRLPSMGEASSTQLLLWQYGLPSLVTQTGWYATLPADTVAFVRPEHEIDDIRAHLADILQWPEKYRALGLNGRRYVDERCTLREYAEGLIRLAHQVRDFRAVWIARQLAAHAGEGMGGWSKTRAGELAANVAEQIYALANGAATTSTRENVSAEHVAA